MVKPVIQIRIEGPQGSGKTELANAIAWVMRSQMRYKVISGASVDDDSNHRRLEDRFHIVEIRTYQRPSNPDSMSRLRRIIEITEEQLAQCETDQSMNSEGKTSTENGLLAEESGLYEAIIATAKTLDSKNKNKEVGNG